MLIKMFKELRARREREKVYNGIMKMKEYLDEMRASGEYSEEKLNNISRWLGEACVQYAKMF